MPDPTSRTTPRFRWGMRAKIALFAVTATAAVLVLNAYLTGRYVSERWLETIAESSAADIDEIKVVLTEQMRTGDRGALARLVHQIGKAPGVAWVSLIDEKGVIRYSSVRGEAGAALAPDSLEMQLLAGSNPDPTPRSRTFRRKDCSVLRTMTPLPNAPECASCHPGQRMTGALIIDHALKPAQDTAASTMASSVLGSAAAVVVLLLTLGLGLERVVLRRLDRLRRAAAELGSGDLTVRAADDDPDEVGDLAREFNSMASGLESAVASCSTERRQLKEILRGIADGVVLLDTRLALVTTNRACQERLDGTAAVPGMAYREFIAAAGLVPRGILPAERALRSGTLEKDVFAVAAEGRTRFEEIYAQPLCAQDGTVSGVIEVWRDISERKALEAGVERAERLAALGLLASSVAHEVGNPLAAIMAALDALLEDVDHPAARRPEEVREYLQLARKQVFRCRNVTDRLLGFSRSPSAVMIDVDAAAAVRETLALVGPHATSQRVDLRADLDQGLLVRASEHLLQHVFLNLATNAVRAMSHGGVLSVTARRHGDEVVVRFADTGPGVPEHVRSQLFKPFSSFRPDANGTGLGLFICRTLVDRCGGSIELESASGAGATFSVHLPGPARANVPAEAASA